jgi:HIT domain
MSAPPLLPGADPSCPFCAIASAFPPVPPSSTFDLQSSASVSDAASDPLHPENTFPPSYVILSTPDVIAFLDIAPLTRGHILLATRRHLVKTVNLTTTEGAEVRACAFLEPQSFAFDLNFPSTFTVSQILL